MRPLEIDTATGGVSLGRKLSFLAHMPWRSIEAIEALRDGGQSTVRFSLPGRAFLIVRDRRLARTLLVDEAEHFPKAAIRLSRLERSLTRDHLHRRLLEFPNDNNFWSRERPSLARSFDPGQLRRYAAASADHAAKMAEAWLALPSGQINNIGRELKRMVFSALVVNLAGRLDGAEKFERIEAAFDTVSQFLVSRAINPLHPPAWLPVVRNRATRRAMHDLSDLLQDLHPPGPEAAPIWMKLAKGDIEYRFQLMSLLIAGYETTSSALAWTLLILADEPELQAAIAAEAEVPADRPKPQTALALTEALGLFPPLWALGLRQAVCERVVYDTVFKTGDMVFISPWLLHDRSRSGSGHRAPLAFGAGPTVCIGRSYAMATMTAALGKLLQRIRIEKLGSPAETLRRRVTLILQPADSAVILTVRRR